MSYQAIIFDCDGVLVDSDPISLEILRKMLSDLGWALSYNECKALFMGKSAKAEIELIQKQLGQPLDREWIQAYIVRRNRALGQHLVAVPGIQDCLAAVHNIWPHHIACASAADKSKIVLQLDKVGLTHFFNGQLFSGTDTERNKPYPDVYLSAAQALNVDIKDCAIIEDSITGVTAGFSAGATVYAYCPEGEDPEPLLQAGAQHIFHHMQHLPLLLQDKTSNKS